MKNKLQKALPVVLVLLGLGALHLLLRKIGYAEVGAELGRMGAGFFLLVAAFLPQFILNTWSWWKVLGPESGLSGPFDFLRLVGVTLVSSAWSNLGPVSRSLGEAGRAFLVSRYTDRKTAVRSVLMYNVGQAFGTLVVFAVGALLAPLLFSLSRQAALVSFALGGIALSLKGIAFLWISTKRRRQRRDPKQRLRKLRHNFAWTGHQIRKFRRQHPGSFAGAVLLAAAARCSETLAIWEAFSLLGNPLSGLEALAVEIGRGIADNVFFFMPYQIGTREYSLLYITNDVIHNGGAIAVSAVLAFRLAEVAWIVIGLGIAPVLTHGPSVRALPSRQEA